jgi:hypothetical protein
MQPTRLNYYLQYVGFFPGFESTRSCEHSGLATVVVDNLLQSEGK